MKGITIAVLAAITVMIIGMIALASGNNKDLSSLEELQGKEGVVYTSFACGCCDIHADYTKRNTGMNMNIRKIDPYTLDSIKDELGVPSNVQTCHTTMIDDYFVEGHIPMEAINKLLAEKPDIRGIALPGMPSGSPGMPGRKTEDFVILAVNNDGTTYEFMRI